jgi:hypothetical protein
VGGVGWKGAHQGGLATARESVAMWTMAIARTKCSGDECVDAGGLRGRAVLLKVTMGLGRTDGGWRR